MDWQDSNLAGVEDQLHQLRHEGVSEGEGLQVGVHQRREQHWQQVTEHGRLGYLFQAFQPEQEEEKRQTCNVNVMESWRKNKDI